MTELLPDMAQRRVNFDVINCERVFDMVGGRICRMHTDVFFPQYYADHLTRWHFEKEKRKELYYDKTKTYEK